MKNKDHIISIIIKRPEEMPDFTSEEMEKLQKDIERVLLDLLYGRKDVEYDAYLRTNKKGELITARNRKTA